MLAVQVRHAERMMTHVAVGDQGLEVRFADGRQGLIPFADLEGIEEAGVIERLDLPNPYEIHLHLRSGSVAEVPWDFARHYCDPMYRAKVEVAAAEGRRSIGNRIRELRLRAGMTQESLARVSGIGRVTLVRIENGEQSPRYASLLAIAEALHVQAGELLAV